MQISIEDNQISRYLDELIEDETPVRATDGTIECHGVVVEHGAFADGLRFIRVRENHPGLRVLADTADTQVDIFPLPAGTDGEPGQDPEVSLPGPRTYRVEIGSLETGLQFSREVHGATPEGAISHVWRLAHKEHPDVRWSGEIRVRRA